MELGGNAPFLVFEDADIEQAVQGAMIAKMRNGGEACTAANRFLVQRPVAEAFTRRLTEAMSALKVGPGIEADTDCGPLVDRAGGGGLRVRYGKPMDSANRTLGAVLCRLRLGLAHRRP